MIQLARTVTRQEFSQVIRKMGLRLTSSEQCHWKIWRNYWSTDPSHGIRKALALREGMGSVHYLRVESKTLREVMALL